MKLKDLLDSKVLNDYRIKVYNELSEELYINPYVLNCRVISINATISTKTAFIKVDEQISKLFDQAVSYD